MYLSMVASMNSRRIVAPWATAQTGDAEASGSAAGRCRCVFVGRDAVTGRDRYLSRTIRGTDRAARREAEKIMTRLIAGSDTQRTAGDVHVAG